MVPEATTEQQAILKIVRPTPERNGPSI
jgi:hypothetical protein